MPIILLATGTYWSVLSYRIFQNSDYSVDQLNLRQGKEMWPTHRFFPQATGRALSYSNGSVQRGALQMV
jgi:hypothetical protein